MSEEKIILEVNPRTKEKKLVKITNLQLIEGYTVADLLKEHNENKKQIKSLILLNQKLIDVIANLNKSTAVQIADIKEDLK
jgi:hypothetical protein